MISTRSPLYQKAFEQYLRKGTPVDIAIKALLKAQANETPHYIWRTSGDDKVRPSHAANEGRVFAWNNPPDTGNPGEAPNCRCTAEPYYGPYDPPIEPVYPELIFLPLARLGKILGALVRAIRMLGTDTLTTAQARNLERFDKKLPKDAGKITVSNGSNGQRVFTADVPARNIPGSFARYEKVVDRAGNTVSYTKTTYGPRGEVISRKVKFGE
jgi:SPP1 gp7 family putative phage head morphogenesis protein